MLILTKFRISFFYRWEMSLCVDRSMKTNEKRRNKRMQDNETLARTIRNSFEHLSTLPFQLYARNNGPLRTIHIISFDGFSNVRSFLNVISFDEMNYFRRSFHENYEQFYKFTILQCSTHFLISFQISQITKFNEHLAFVARTPILECQLMQQRIFQTPFE